MNPVRPEAAPARAHRHLVRPGGEVARLVQEIVW
jgi:hypothetical protein